MTGTGIKNLIPNIKRRLTASKSPSTPMRLRSKSNNSGGSRNSLRICNHGAFKILVIGAKNVGKTTICQQYVAHEPDETEREMQIYDTSIFITVDEETRQYDLELFVEDVESVKKDISDYKSLLTKSDGFMLVYSKHNKNSFMKLFEIMADIEHFTNANSLPMVVVGNTLGDHDCTHEVNNDDLICLKHKHIQVESDTDKNIQKAFSTLINLCISHKDVQLRTPKSLSTNGV